MSFRTVPFLIAMLSIVAHAADSATTPSAGELEALTTALSNSEFQTREDAAAKLTALGRGALPTLKKLEGSSDPEVQHRAVTISKAIHKKLSDRALTITVTPEKKTCAVGEEVKIDLSVTNKEDFPVTIALCQEDALCGYAGISVLTDGKALTLADRLHPPKQTMLGGVIKVPADRFHTLQPGESLKLYRVAFSEWWVRYPNPIGDKGESSKLKPATYKVKAEYFFAFDFSRASRINFVFEGDAEALLEQAWQGKLEAEAEFKVEAAVEKK